METQVLKQVYGEAESDAQFEDESDFYEVSDPREVEVIEHLCSRVYQDYKWEVHRPWLTIEEAHKRFNVPVSTIRWACKEGLIEEAGRVIGGWEFPLAAFVEITRNNAFATCREVLSISVASDGTYAFECLSEEILFTCAADFLPGVETLLIVSNRFGLPLFSEDSSSLMISRHATAMNLEFEHFLSERPWTDVQWSYDAFAKATVSQARQYDFIESEWQESERAGRSFVDSMRFRFTYESSPSCTLGELVDQAVNTLSNVIQDVNAHLSGGPIWKEEYEKDEALFCDEVLTPLLRRMGFRYVRYTHGRGEFGKDFTFSQSTEFGELYYGLQAQAGNVRGGVNSEIDKLLKQIKDAFTIPYREVGSHEEKYIAVLIIAISGRFTENAEKKIEYNMPKRLVGSVYFWDKEKILGLIARYWGARG